MDTPVRATQSYSTAGREAGDRGNEIYRVQSAEPPQIHQSCWRSDLDPYRLRRDGFHEPRVWRERWSDRSCQRGTKTRELRIRRIQKRKSRSRASGSDETPPLDRGDRDRKIPCRIEGSYETDWNACWQRQEAPSVPYNRGEGAGRRVSQRGWNVETRSVRGRLEQSRHWFQGIGIRCSLTVTGLTQKMRKGSRSLTRPLRG